MLKPFGLSIFFYKTKTILSTKNIRKYTHEYATSISQNTHICFAKYSHSNTKYIATNLQQHNIQKTKTILLQCKNPLFARQKPYFYTAKTILLFCEHVTYTEWTRCEHSVNIHIQPRVSQRTLIKTPNLHSARRRGRFIVPVSLHCQIRIFPLSNMCIRFIANGCPHLKIRIFKSPHTHFCSPFCGCLRVWGRDKSAPTAANGLLITLLANWNNMANILQNIHVQPRNSQRTLTKTPNLHSARRRGRFIVPVSLHYQIHIFTSSHTYVQITTPALSQ